MRNYEQMSKELSASRDRISNILKKQAEPSFGDEVSNVGQSLLSALSANAGAAGFEQNYQAKEQSKMQAANSLYKLMQDEVQQGNQDAAAVDKAIKDITADDVKGYEEIANIIHQSPEKIGQHNASMAVAKAANSLGYKPKLSIKDQVDVDLKRAHANHFNQRGSTGIGSNGTKAPLGYRYTPDGNLESIPGGPADKGIKVDDKEKGKEQVSYIGNRMKELYNKLDEEGGIVNPDKGTLHNLKARIRSGEFSGQVVGKALGTKEQSQRQEINNLRNQLKVAIMSATGLSAKAFDSNAEAKSLLDSFGDPAKDVQSNLKAVDSFLERYGKEGYKYNSPETDSGNNYNGYSYKIRNKK